MANSREGPGRWKCLSAEISQTTVPLSPNAIAVCRILCVPIVTYCHPCYHQSPTSPLQTSCLLLWACNCLQTIALNLFTTHFQEKKKKLNCKRPECLTYPGNSQSLTLKPTPLILPIIFPSMSPFSLLFSIVISSYTFCPQTLPPHQTFPLFILLCPLLVYLILSLFCTNNSKT